jgi:hypothetical protein
MRHRFGTPLHYAFGNCPVAARCCQTAARKRSASDMEMVGHGDVGSGLALSWGVSEAVALARSFRLASPAAVSHVTSCGYA